MTDDKVGGMFRNIRAKTWVTAGAAIAILAVAAVLFVRSKPTTPAVAEMLSARDTVGFVAVESPDIWLQAFDRATATLSTDERRNLDAWLSPEKRALALGFDPATALGWQKAGVDPERGIALSMDKRHFSGTFNGPSLWVAGGPPHSTLSDAMKWHTLAEWSVAAVGLASAPTAIEEGPLLAGDPVFRAAFADMPTGARTTFYAHGDGILAAMRPHLAGKPLALVEHLTPRIRGLALVISPQRTAGRVVLSSDAIESLRQIFATTAPKQPFSRFLPQDGVLALRVSLNLPELFDGLMGWLPPQWLDARLGLAGSRLGLLAVSGLDWTQLERALAGQAVVALDLAAPPTPDVPLPWLGLLAVRDAAVTDLALKQLVEKSNQRGVPVVAVQVAGNPGWQMQVQGFVAVRVADTLILAPNLASAERAVHQPKPLAAQTELDEDVVLGLVFQPTQTPPKEGDRWRVLLGSLEPMAMALRRDTHGLRLDASTFPLSSLLHIAAWFLRAN
jgi:hypothetical protein